MKNSKRNQQRQEAKTNRYVKGGPPLSKYALKMRGPQSETAMVAAFREAYPTLEAFNAAADEYDQ